MSRHQHLSAIHRGQRIEHRGHRLRVDAVFRLLNQEDTFQIGQIGRQRETGQPQRAIGDQPGRHGQAASIPVHHITMAVFGPLHRLNVFQVGQHRAQMRDPRSVARGVVLPETAGDPGDVGPVGQESGGPRRRTRLPGSRHC